MSTREIPPSRLRGGRVADAGSFPDTHEQRVEAMRRLSARLYAIARPVREDSSGLPDRLIGGRIDRRRA